MITRTASTKKKDIATRNSLLAVPVFLFITAGSVLCQDRDAGLWTGFELEKGLNSWLDLRGSVEMRRNNNLALTERYFGEFGVGADLGKFLEASINYRYNHRFVPEYNWISLHRVYADLRVEYDWNYFTLSERFRLTLDRNPEFLRDTYIESKARARTQVQYNIRKTPLRIRTAVELFAPLTGKEVLYAEESRYILGVVCVINPSMSLEISHYYERDRYRNKPQYNYIWVLRMKYTL